MNLDRKSLRLVSLLIGVMLAIVLLVVPGSLAASLRADPRDKVDPQVLAATANGKTTEFLVVMTEQADVSGAYRLPTKQAKGRYVFDTLHSLAQRSQANIRAYLDKRGVSYRGFYTINMLKVTGGQDLVLALAARADVSRIDANPYVRVALPKPQEGGAPGPDTIEWNVTKVRAPDVWALGYTGQNMVVASADTGVQWDHPALKPHYRGWDGTTADHNYNWWDAVSGQLAPYDDYGHGTHTTGTMIGDDGAGNQIGVAPGAKWMGCKNMDSGGVGSPARYTECMDFTLAPWDLNMQNPDPSLAPDSINNSWTCPTSEGCTDPNVLLTPIENLRAAGIVFVASAGNSGPSCSTVSDPPAIYDPSTTMGATDSSDTLAYFSSKGPVTRDGSNRLKPDLSAPGVSVRSAWPPNTYAFESGTSMASPHVTGGVALLWSARPWLEGNVDLTEYYLEQSAVQTLGVPSPPTTCGGTAYNVFPNNLYGWGRVDLLAALNLIPEQTPTPTVTGTAPTPTETETPSGPTPTPTPLPSVWQYGPTTGFQFWRFDGEFDPDTNKVYFLGGRKSDNSTDGSVWSFDPIAGTYASTGAVLQTPISNYTIGRLQDSTGWGLYVFGGRDSSGNGTTAVQVYYPSTNTVATISTDPWPGSAGGAPTIAAAVAVYGNKAYAFGGLGISAGSILAVSAQTWVFDPMAPAGSHWTAGPDLNRARGYIANAIVDGLIYAIGGDDWVSPNLLVLPNTERLDPNNLAGGWTSVADMPVVPTTGVPGCDETQATGFDTGGPYSLSGVIVVAGCGQWVNEYADSFIYTVASDSWATFPSLNSARRNHAGAFIPPLGTGSTPAMWVWGGRQGSDSNILTSSEYFLVAVAATPTPTETPLPPTETPTETAVPPTETATATPVAMWYLYLPIIMK